MWDWCIITMMSVPYIENIWWPSMKGCVPWIMNNYLYSVYIYIYIYIYRHSLSMRETFFIMPKLVSEVYKLHPRLMTLICQSWETSLSHLNWGETPFAALPMSQLTLSKIGLTLGLHVITYRILSCYHSLSNHHE